MEDDSDDGKVEEPIRRIEAASKSCSTVSLAMIAACLFCLLTCGTFSDAELITRAAVTSSIPAVGLSLPVQRFIESAPWILLVFQVYFLVHLQTYKELVHELVSRDPKGLFQCSNVNTSVLNSLIDPLEKVRRPRKQNISRWERTLAVIVAYLLVPFSVFNVWLRTLALHGKYGISAVLALIALLISVVISIWQSTDRLSAQDLPSRESGQPLAQGVRYWGCGLLLVAFVTIAYFNTFPLNEVLLTSYIPSVLVLALSFAVLLRRDSLEPLIALMTKARCPRGLTRRLRNMDGSRARLFLVVAVWFSIGASVTGQAYLGVIPEIKNAWFKETVRYFETARVRNLELSKRPPGWEGTKLELVTGALLQNQNLRYLFGFQAFAVNSHFDKADLTGATLAEADLRGASFDQSVLQAADLSRARLAHATLTHTRLCGASLSRADLRHANLRGAMLQGSDLRYANLKGADLTSALLDEADLTGADLTGADLRGSNLTKEQLRKSACHDMAKLPSDPGSPDLAAPVDDGSDLDPKGPFVYRTELEPRAVSRWVMDNQGSCSRMPLASER